MISKDKKSPNFDERLEGVKPSMLILHYTGMETAEIALAQLCDPESKVSAHYFIDEDGQVSQLVEDQDRAWHAGVAHWAGESDINSHSIGIEIVNPGHEFGYKPFSDDQIAPLVELCKIKIEEWNIKPSGVLAHSDVAPSRKFDPGHLFPWERLATENIGFWPQVEEMDLQAAEDLLGNEDAILELLVAFGYNVSENYNDLMVAFHRRFCPEKFSAWDDRPEEPDLQSIAKLLALIRLHHETS